MSFDLNWILTRKFRVPPIKRLLSKVEVDDNGCWNYTGQKDQYGYGVFKIGGRNLGAHKISYILHNGDFDQSKFEMMHECHNRKCINPDHIKPGTHKQNMSYSETRRRMTLAGGRSRGNNPYIFNLVASKKGETMLFGSSYQAQLMGFSSGSISCSCNNVKWRGKYKGFKWSYEGVGKVN